MDNENKVNKDLEIEKAKKFLLKERITKSIFWSIFTFVIMCIPFTVFCFIDIFPEGFKIIDLIITAIWCFALSTFIGSLVLRDNYITDLLMKHINLFYKFVPTKFFKCYWMNLIVIRCFVIIGLFYVICLETCALALVFVYCSFASLYVYPSSLIKSIKLLKNN